MTGQEEAEEVTSFKLSQRRFSISGVRCDTVCEAGRWGPGCEGTCQCEHGTCDSVTGTCRCERGYTGPRCDIPCSPGYYGVSCRQACPPCNASECHLSHLCAFILCFTRALSPSFIPFPPFCFIQRIHFNISMVLFLFYFPRLAIVFLSLSCQNTF